MIINSFIEVFSLLMIYLVLFEEITIRNIVAKLFLSIICIGPNVFIRDRGIINLLIAISLISIAFKVFNKLSFYRIIVRIFISISIVLIAEAIVGIVIGIFRISVASYQLTLVLILILTLDIILTKVFAKSVILELEDKILENIKVYLLLVFNFLLILTLFQYINNRFNLENVELVFIFSIALVMVIINIILIRKITEEIKRKKVLELESQYNPILVQYFESLKAREHEYKNHLNIIYTMLDVSSEEKTREVVKDYIKSTVNKDYLSKLIHIDNDVLKALIYSKICEAEEKGIIFKYEINTNLVNLKMDNSELGILLSNLLNNAFEAVEECERKLVHLEVEKLSVNNKDTYKIIVKNSVKDFNNINVSQMFLKGYSTKGSNRGFGLYNIQKIIKKASGNISIEADKDIINIEITL